MPLAGWEGRDRYQRHLEKGKVRNSPLRGSRGMMSAEPLGQMYFSVLASLRPRGCRQEAGPG